VLIRPHCWPLPMLPTLSCYAVRLAGRRIETVRFCRVAVVVVPAFAVALQPACTPRRRDEDDDQLCSMAASGLQADFYGSKKNTGPWTDVTFYFCVSSFGISGGSDVFVVFLPVSLCLSLVLSCSLSAAQCVGLTGSNQMYLSTPLQEDSHRKG